jgi:hypothetical protein
MALFFHSFSISWFFFPSSTMTLFGWAVTFEKIIVSCGKAAVEKTKGWFD